MSTYKSLNWTGTFWDYVEMLEQNPSIARNSYQRLYDMVMSHGVKNLHTANANTLNTNSLKVLETFLFMVLRKI